MCLARNKINISKNFFYFHMTFKYTNLSQNFNNLIEITGKVDPLSLNAAEAAKRKLFF